MELFSIFLWKNLKYIKFCWKSTFGTFVTCIALLTLYEHFNFHETPTPNIVYSTQSEEALNSFLSLQPGDVLCYTPPAAKSFIEVLRYDLSIRDEDTQMFDNEESMYVFLNGKKNTHSYGISFHDWGTNGTTSKNVFKYTITSTSSSISTKEFLLNDKTPVRTKEFDGYALDGFLTLQLAINKNYLSEQQEEFPYEIEISPFPRAASLDRHAKFVDFGVFFMVYFSILLLSTLLVPLVEEKHDGIKGFLRLVTEFSFLNELTFCIIRIAIYALFLTYVISIGYYYKALLAIPACYVVGLFVLFSLAFTSYSFLISILFNSVFFAKICGLIAFAIQIFPHFVLDRSACGPYYITGNAFLEALETFTVFENKNREFTSESLNIEVIDGAYKISTSYLILFAHFIIYTILYAYLSEVFPGKATVPRPFGFFLNMWRKTNFRKHIFPNFESSNGNNVVEINNLCKTFSYGINNRRDAVKDFSMNITNKRITVLLGHNGAGKTTTINMLVGCIPKTSGTISVLGLEDVAAYRHLIGYCPQHNIYMRYLTCEEHLIFFAKVRGMDDTTAKAHAQNILREVHLEHKAKEYGNNLSGGMKRRLSLGLAITGETKVIILDEPTSGLDLKSRRNLWNILLELRKKQAILITTHYMEEAERLADEVFIMSHGQLICSGTTFSLKKQYGSGYVLKLLMRPDTDEEAILSLIRSHDLIPKSMTFVKPTLSISLPYEGRNIYAKLLEDLEQNMTSLGIQSVGITNTSLEEVFLNCETVDQPDQGISIPYRHIEEQQREFPDQFLRKYQILAIFYKKLIYIKREWSFVLTMFLLPILSMVVSYIAMTSTVRTSTTQLPKLIFSRPFKAVHENQKIYLSIPESQINFRNLLKEEILSMEAMSLEIPEKNVSIENFLIKLQNENLYRFHEEIFGAIDVDDKDSKPVVRIFYSSNAIHSSAVMLNLISNVMFKKISGQNALIEASNAPIKQPVSITRTKLEVFANLVHIGISIYMLLYLTLPYKEKRTQFMSLERVPRHIYWLSTFAVDMLLHLAICIILLILQIILEEIYSIYSSNEIVAIFFTILCYGLVGIPTFYMISLTFSTLVGLTTWVFLIILISAVVPLITSINISVMKKNEALILILNVIPEFNLKNQLFIINENYFINKQNELMKRNIGKTVPLDPIGIAGSKSDHMSETIFFVYVFVIMIAVKLLLIFVWDNVNKRETLSKYFSCQYYAYKVHSYRHNASRAESGEHLPLSKSGDSRITDTALLVTDLHKTYLGLHAVKGINFIVSDGECFGLLGVNGAGKTSTFQMLTGNKQITKGKVHIKNQDLQTNLYNIKLGYCPQVDALNHFMSSYEILKYMAMLRGISYRDAHDHAEYWIDGVGLVPYRDSPISQYSGGTKRKLSTALAMIGNPKIIFLDEPTAGVDPLSRRAMWQCIQNAQKENQTIVLSSHSMEECEYLCNQIAIMEEGIIKRKGYIPDLKANNQCAFELTLKIKENAEPEKVWNLRDQIKNKFDGQLKEDHANILAYHVTKRFNWSTVFKYMNSIYEEYEVCLDDYSIKEPTLESLFLDYEE